MKQMDADKWSDYEFFEDGCFILFEVKVYKKYNFLVLRFLVII